MVNECTSTLYEFLNVGSVVTLHLDNNHCLKA